MLFPVLIPVLIGLFLLAMERLEARVYLPPDHDAGGPGPQGSANAVRTGSPSGGAAPGGGAGPPTGERDRALPGGRDPRPGGAGVTALEPAECSVARSEAQVHGARHTGNEADIDRQDSGRRIEGRGPWTHR
jgi:hypothetical protein